MVWRTAKSSRSPGAFSIVMANRSAAWASRSGKRTPSVAMPTTTTPILHHSTPTSPVAWLSNPMMRVSTGSRPCNLAPTPQRPTGCRRRAPQRLAASGLAGRDAGFTGIPGGTPCAEFRYRSGAGVTEPNRLPTPSLPLRKAIVQRVAGAANGADRVLLAAGVEQFAQAADMNVDGALVDIDV